MCIKRVGEDNEAGRLGFFGEEKRREEGRSVIR